MFGLLLAIDGFLFEFRSTYEILGRFLQSFCELLGEPKPTEAELLALLNSRGSATHWAVTLRERRKLFFHETAPWIAYRVHSLDPFDGDEIILHEPGADPEAPTEALAWEELQGIYQGFAESLSVFQEWLLEKIAALET
jgi:hypothetical protein